MDWEKILISNIREFFIQKLVVQKQVKLQRLIDLVWSLIMLLILSKKRPRNFITYAKISIDQLG